MRATWLHFIAYIIAVFIIYFSFQVFGLANAEQASELAEIGIIGGTWYQLSIWFKSLFWGIEDE